MRTQSSVSLAYRHSNLVHTEAKCWGRVNDAAAGFTVGDTVRHSSRTKKYLSPNDRNHTTTTVLKLGLTTNDEKLVLNARSGDKRVSIMIVLLIVHHEITLISHDTNKGFMASILILFYFNIL